MCWTVLAAVTFGLVTWTCLRITVGNRQLGELQDQDASGTERWPSVSVVVAARNEEENLRTALESLLRIDYENYEVIMVDDRSADRTAEILEGYAAGHSILTCICLILPTTPLACLIALASHSSSLPPSSRHSLRTLLAIATHCSFWSWLRPFLCSDTSLTVQGIANHLTIYQYSLPPISSVVYGFEYYLYL